MCLWTEELDKELIELINLHGRKWTMLSEVFSVSKTPAALRSRWEYYLCANPKRGKPDYTQIQNPSNPIQKQIQKRKHQFNADGSETDERVIPEEALQTRESLLIAHGYNPKEFELVTSLSNYWDMADKELGIKTLYQSKITVKPAQSRFDMQALIETIETKKKPYRYNIYIKRSVPDRYLTIPSFDTHFDGETLPLYRESLEKTLLFIENNYFKDSLLILGGDICHVDSISNTTTKGTQLETTDINAAFDEMEEYYETIIEALLHNSRTIQVMQLNGNHDNTLGYAFARVLRKAYSHNERMSFDVDLKQRKATMLGNNFIGGSHGDKGKKQYPQLFATEFAEMWAKATNREYYTGHLHHEMTKDDGGILHRQMPTLKNPDIWHTENGFTMASKRFQLVTYTADTTESVVYV